MIADLDTDTNAQEAEDAIISLNDDDPATVKRMLKYLYTLDYCDGELMTLEPGTNNTVDCTTLKKIFALQFDANEMSRPIEEAIDFGKTTHCKLINNARVYALAEKYNITALMESARIKFGYLSYKSYIRCGDLFNAEVVALVFESTPDSSHGLRDIVIEVCAVRVDRVLQDEGLCEEMRKHGQFGLGVLHQVYDLGRNRCFSFTIPLIYRLNHMHNAVSSLEQLYRNEAEHPLLLRLLHDTTTARDKSKKMG